MIIIDTHIWVWWIHNDDRLTEKIREYIKTIVEMMLTKRSSGFGFAPLRSAKPNR